ncbi:hypothetical protein CONLIGDRAFT_683667 [Coniochaeta ligniaria NRRL 30616]|uniref:Uncharacterized protein n=1 Tax=Coniochaeta ligniaria NRRL 30616 TaxID=1408157 RepID=A0A1J7JAC7_9PEZI|nr:hypothetical protein CONLIGDRAFT_683667 [Coniochaeta ligniaria NRRL 30616]
MDTADQPVDSIEGSPSRRDVSLAGKRLFWTLNGPLENSIQVAPDRWYEPGTVMEPYFRPALDGAPSWHPVSRESLMEPEVSSVTVRVGCIDDWELLWVDLHYDCYDADDARHPERWGRNPDIDDADDANAALSRKYLQECNGQKRPRAKETQLVVTTSGAFLTVHEYVSAVHPWLMDMRETLLDVLGKVQGNKPWPTETKLVVVDFGSGPLGIGDEKQWVSRHTRPPVRKPGASSFVALDATASEERSRRRDERMLAMSAARIQALQALH